MLNRGNRPKVLAINFREREHLVAEGLERWPSGQPGGLARQRAAKSVTGKIAALSGQ
jgi:hypothetical protein